MEGEESFARGVDGDDEEEGFHEPDRSTSTAESVGIEGGGSGSGI